MITWMQKHKKYLVVTIWISTIAFLGAGFVGWGAYSFSSSTNAVAMVGDTKVSIQAMQQEYNRLYNIYNQLSGGTLDKEKAKQMGIEDQALNNLISKTLMLNYAYDLGLRVSKEEIVEEITKMDMFLNNGKFDEKIYKQLLEDNNLRPKDFEESTKESLLLQKLNPLLDIPLSKEELEMLKNAYFTEDSISIAILDKAKISFNPQEEAIKKYWEENKDIYQTQRSYEIESILVKNDDFSAQEEDLKKYYDDFKNQFLDENGQIIPYEQAKDKVLESFKDSQAQKQALKEYITLRKGENTKATKEILTEDDKKYGIELINLLSQAKENDTLKPIKAEKSYITLRVKKIIPSQPKEYAQAKEDATKDFIVLEKTKLLEKEAQKEIQNFKGENIGYISRDTKEIKGLSENETTDFIAQLFNQKEANGYILLENKAILYKISQQRLQNSDIILKNLDFLTQNGTQLKSRLIEKDFIEYLLNLYPVSKKI